MNIDKIQQNYIYKVDPVNFFETRKQNPSETNRFNTGLFAQQTNDNFNLNHPKITGSESRAKSLDLLA